MSNNQYYCWFSFEALDPNHPNLELRQFVICSQCRAAYHQKYWDELNACLRCQNESVNLLEDVAEPLPYLSVQREPVLVQPVEKYWVGTFKQRPEVQLAILIIMLMFILLIVGTILNVKHQQSQKALAAQATYISYQSTQVSFALTETAKPTQTLMPSPIPPTATFTPIPPTETSTTSITPAPEVGSVMKWPTDGAEMVYIPAGEFLLGSTAEDLALMIEMCPLCDRDTITDQSPQRQIALNAFWIDQTEVTNAQFANFVETTGYRTDAEKAGTSLVYVSGVGFRSTSGASWHSPTGPGLNYVDQHPVRHVSWNDAVAYCAWAELRLPTEAEWEKAARGEHGFFFPWGNQKPAVGLINANFVVGSPSNVGSYLQGASPYGSLDMAGNLWEWVADFYDENYFASAPSTNPMGPETGQGHVLRGGSWASEYDKELVYLMTTFRFWNYPDFRSDVLGFRCATETLRPTKTNTLERTLVPDPVVSITYPSNGASVGQRVDVTGRISGLIPGGRAFLCIKSTAFNQLTWPQGEILPDSNGNWVVEGVYQSPGYAYETFVVVTENVASAEMLADQYYRASGMSDLPAGTILISPVIVVNRE
jgi:formylglycine-generating enzyme required for sulfatase activity